MKCIFFALIIATGLWACNSKPSGQTGNHDMADVHHQHPEVLGDPRAAEVMAIHDSIMPRMEDIMRLKKDLRKEIQELEGLEKSTTNTKRIAEAEALEQRLEQADQHMMGWMRQYSPDTLTDLSDEGAASYLQVQKTRIESVRTAMQQAIASAESYFKEK
ncbi:hypothetical protein [Dyadobacter tibetensis]|uniref:hypothetical protein n=1 Tax=Dyadobacter tibetensis TaxID=1211851 RepID=UPI00046F7DA6|nr:hypothetical protein [Dyadobacter tibetensis]